MFNLEFLHVIREFEYQRFVGQLPPGGRVLEIGGGTGYQAKRLAEDGFDVSSIDIPDSNYANELVFPVQPYDGEHLPFEDQSFDVIFSSNVLEHVRKLPALLSEMRRVLRPGGYCVHLMPTGAWRFWTNLAHYTEMMQRVFVHTPRLIPKGMSKAALRDCVSVVALMADTARHYAIVPRHGEVGSALSEIWTFSARHWVKTFSRHDFRVDAVEPIGLFYTGHMIFGAGIGIPRRQRMSRVIGSACVLYRVSPGHPE